MLIYSSEGYLTFFMVIVALSLTSFAVPIYGLVYKGWKGLALGCLLQPVVACILLLLGGIGVFCYQMHVLEKTRQAAMVVVRTTTIEKEDTLLHTWYLKPDDECLLETRPISEDSTDTEDFKLYDIVRSDSFSLCVDDRIVVRFDPDSRSVTATDFDQPMKIVRVDRDQMADYFRGRSAEHTATEAD